jgi:hypothetical protein
MSSVLISQEKKEKKEEINQFEPLSVSFRVLLGLYLIIPLCLLL